MIYLNILHICNINNSKIDGINNVVPYHFIYQSKYANVAIMNCSNIDIVALINNSNYYNCTDIKQDISNYPFFNKKIDIVIFHGIYFTKYISISNKLNKNKIPYIVIPHGSLTYDAQKIKPLKKRIGNIIFNPFINKSAAIQYLSESEANMSSKFKKNYIISGNGMLKPSKKKNDFSQKGLKIIYVGRYAIYHKGIDKIIEACALIRDFMLKNSIIINFYGAKNDGEDAIKQLATKMNVEKLVNVHGPIFDEKKIDTILKHDVFIQTSRLEGQPLGIMEAMYLGMPVILSDGTTFGKNVMNNNCGYVGNTPEEISNAIINCYNERKNLSKMSLNSFEFANKNFLWDNIAKETINLYKKYL